MIIAIDLMSLIYLLVVIPSIVILSKLGWTFGEYCKSMLDLKWRKAKRELERSWKKND